MLNVFGGLNIDTRCSSAESLGRFCWISFPYVVLPGILTFPGLSWVHLSCVWNITGEVCHLTGFFFIMINTNSSCDVRNIEFCVSRSNQLLKTRHIHPTKKTWLESFRFINYSLNNSSIEENDKNSEKLKTKTYSVYSDMYIFTLATKQVILWVVLRWYDQKLSWTKFLL